MNKLVKIAVIVLIALLLGCAPPAPTGEDAAPMSEADFIISTVWFIILGVFVYFMLVLRPGFAKEDAHKKFIEQLKKHDEVVTSGGIFGRVVAVKAEFVTVEVAPNVRLKVKPEHVHAPPATQPQQSSSGERATEA